MSSNAQYSDFDFDKPLDEWTDEETADLMQAAAEIIDYSPDGDEEGSA